MCVDNARRSWEHASDVNWKVSPRSRRSRGSQPGKADGRSSASASNRQSSWQAAQWHCDRFSGSENVSCSRQGKNIFKKFTDQKGCAHRLLIRMVATAAAGSIVIKRTSLAHATVVPTTNLATSSSAMFAKMDEQKECAQYMFD